VKVGDFKEREWYRFLTVHIIWDILSEMKTVITTILASFCLFFFILTPIGYATGGGGSLTDTPFSGISYIGGSGDDSIIASDIQSDGDIVVGGFVSEYPSGTILRVLSLKV
jgi:hypothetical protein